MFGSYTSLELEAERRRELVEHSLREAVQRQALDDAERERGEATEGSRGFTNLAASFLNRVSQRA